MQKVTKRTRRARPGKWALILVFSAIVLTVALSALLRSADKKEPQETQKRAAEENLLLYQTDTAQLAEIEILRDGETEIIFEYMNGALVLKGDPSFPINDHIVSSLLETAASLTADAHVMDFESPPSDEELSRFGLSPARRSACFRFHDGSEIVLSTGNLMPIENPRYYAMASTKSALYSVTQDVRDAVSPTMESIHPVSRPQINSDLIDRVQVEGTVTFDARRTDAGWEMLSPYVYPLSDALMDNLMSQLDGIRFANWLGKAENMDLKALGLSPANKTLTLTFAETSVSAPDENGENVTFSLPENRMVFSLGDQKNDTSYYLLYEDEVYSVTVLSFSFLTSFSWEKYLSAVPVSFPTNDLSRIYCRLNGSEAEYLISYSEHVLPNNELETDEYGNLLYDLQVTREGQPVDTEAFLSWYGLLSGMTATRLSDRTSPGPGAEPAFEISLTNARGTVTRNVSILPGDAVEDILYVDGVSLFTIDRAWRDLVTAFP